MTRADKTPSGDPADKLGAKPGDSKKQEDRRARSAAALRANLRRRKAGAADAGARGRPKADENKPECGQDAVDLPEIG
jgi:hypothetical protein